MPFSPPSHHHTHPDFMECEGVPLDTPAPLVAVGADYRACFVCDRKRRRMETNGSLESRSAQPEEVGPLSWDSPVEDPASENLLLICPPRSPSRHLYILLFSFDLVLLGVMTTAVFSVHAWIAALFLPSHFVSVFLFHYRRCSSPFRCRCIVTCGEASSLPKSCSTASRGRI